MLDLWSTQFGLGLSLFSVIVSISMSEPISEFDKAESMEVIVMFTFLSLSFRRGSCTAPVSELISILGFSGGATDCVMKLLLFMSSMAFRSCKGKSMRDPGQ